MRRKEYIAFLEDQLDSACKSLATVEQTIKDLNRTEIGWENEE